MERGDRLRLFCGFRLPRDAADAISAWQEHELRGRGRIVARGDLHVTLAFLGSRPAADVVSVVAGLRGAVAGRARPELRVRGYRETRSVGMLTFEDVAGRGAAIAGELQRLLAEAGVYRPEGRDWLAHVTVLRFRERPHLRPPVPQLAPVAPSEAAAYLSVLSPAGAHYEVLESVAVEGG